MRVLFVHPSALMYSELFLRLEPLGLERVAAAAREAGHRVGIIDLQTHTVAELDRELARFRPDAVAFGLNYLANVPEVIDLAHRVKRLRPSPYVFVGGHSVSFIARHVLEQADGAIDAVLRGEGEVAAPLLLAALPDRAAHEVPGAVTLTGTGPGAPGMLPSIDMPLPARDLLRRRKRYFIGVLDPAASVEFTRGCPWDCSFCSAWTFYGRSYRRASPEAAADDLAAVQEPGVFIVDDVAFIRPEHGDAIAAELERRKIRKQYYLETRADVLLRNEEVFQRWRRLGLKYMFLGMEALDAEGLDLFRKRVSPDDNFRALEVARKLGLAVAINLIVDPQWDVERFRQVREWALAVPEIVHLSVMTPYPGTEIWHTEARALTTLDYRLFDIQHAVLPTRLPLQAFYRELVKTQEVINRKHLGVPPWPRPRASWAGTSRTARRTSPACCGSSIRSITPSASTPIIPGRSTTSCPSRGITMWHRAIVDNSTSMRRHRGGRFRGPRLRVAREKGLAGEGSTMRVLVLGGDGYLGWPTAVHLSDCGHTVAVADNFARRGYDHELGVDSLVPVEPLRVRVRAWAELSGRRIETFCGDITDASSPAGRRDCAPPI